MIEISQAGSRILRWGILALVVVSAACSTKIKNVHIDPTYTPERVAESRLGILGGEDPDLIRGTLGGILDVLDAVLGDDDTKPSSMHPDAPSREVLLETVFEKLVKELPKKS